MRILSLYIVGSAFSLFISNVAFASCPDGIPAPRLELTLKSACMIEAYIKSQIANPNDLIRPQFESPAPSDRRLKHIDNWNKGTVSNSKPGETIK